MSSVEAEEGVTPSIDDVIEITAAWLDEEPSWIRHVVDVRFQNGFKVTTSCRCGFDAEYGHEYCEKYLESQKSVLTPEQQEQERKRQEAWKVVQEATDRAYNEMVNKYREMGWLP
jgi:hypothetical protein